MGGRGRGAKRAGSPSEEEAGSTWVAGKEGGVGSPRQSEAEKIRENYTTFITFCNQKEGKKEGGNKNGVGRLLEEGTLGSLFPPTVTVV